MNAGFSLSARRCLAALVTTVLSTAASACPASRPLSVVVPYPTGGSLDATSRLLAAAVSERLGRELIVRNVPGASGAIGAREAMAAPRDGCTVLVGAINTLVLVPMLNAQAGFGIGDFRPLAKVGHTEMAVIAAATVPVAGLSDLAAHTRAIGRPLNVGHPGAETVQALALDLLEERVHAGLVPVPYAGSARMVSDLLGGHLDLAVVALPVAMPLLRQQRIRILGSFTPGEGFELDSWSGWFVAAGVAVSATTALEAALREALRDEDVQRALLRLGAPTPRRGEQERFAEDVRRSSQRYARVLGATRRTAP